MVEGRQVSSAIYFVEGGYSPHPSLPFRSTGTLEGDREEYLKIRETHHKEISSLYGVDNTRFLEQFKGMKSLEKSLKLPEEKNPKVFFN